MNLKFLSVIQIFIFASAVASLVALVFLGIAANQSNYFYIPFFILLPMPEIAFVILYCWGDIFKP